MTATIRKYTLDFSEIDMKAIDRVGGKNASLGEMYQHLTAKGIRIPDGFATTAEAYWRFLDKNQLREPLTALLETLDTKDFSNLQEIGEKARKMILQAALPGKLQVAIISAYDNLVSRTSGDGEVAVRSSATAEDLPTASFAGQLDSFLNIKGEEALLDACQKCYASLFTDRAIKYRFDHGFDHMKVALSIGIQQMVRSDMASAGVAFTIEPDAGFENVILVNGSWGLGENVVQGTVNPDEFLMFKPSLKSGKQAILSRKLGEKGKTMVYADPRRRDAGLTVVNLDTPLEKREQFVLSDEEVLQLGKWALEIETHYGRPMDIEWAKDGFDEQLYIVQARPETIHSQDSNRQVVHRYHLLEKGALLTSGIGLGNKIATGKVRVLHSPSEAYKLKPGEILVTGNTNPDWDPIMKKAGAIITDKGGRTSHAAIVAREMGTVAVVGTEDGTMVLKNGDTVTVSCAEGHTGKIYQGKLKWREEDIDLEQIISPKTTPLLILGDPENAFQHSRLPSGGIGLLRLEFIINNSIGIHPMALVHPSLVKDPSIRKKIEARTGRFEDMEEFFVDKLSEAVGTLAAAFYPREVIVRMSDFKSNEYANLLGGHTFEPEEENPMLGFRGASRYYHERYREGFELECRAMQRVRDDLGFTNVKLMIPFCRTLEEGRAVINLMEEYGLKRGKNGLEIYVMIELPSNVVLAEGFAEIFDGFSIGSNDLTQLTLGLDRDSALISNLFDENNEAVTRMIRQVIQVAKKTGTPIGLCGQAPSDFPEFTRFLVEEGIDSISFTPDALLQGIENIHLAEKAQVVVKG